jgi:hypothetical protein
MEAPGGFPDTILIIPKLVKIELDSPGMYRYVIYLWRCGMGKIKELLVEPEDEHDLHW